MHSMCLQFGLNCWLLRSYIDFSTFSNERTELRWNYNQNEIRSFQRCWRLEHRILLHAFFCCVSKVLHFTRWFFSRSLDKPRKMILMAWHGLNEQNLVKNSPPNADIFCFDIYANPNIQIKRRLLFLLYFNPTYGLSLFLCKKRVNLAHISY